MKSLRHKLLILLIAALITSSCESYLINGNLDGFWQVTSIENKQIEDTTYCNGDIYYSFQRELVLVSYVSPNIPAGQIKENYIAYFTHDNDSIAMTDFRRYLDSEGTKATQSALEKFGLYDTHNTFLIEKLNSKELIFNSDKARIIFKKY
ncbi:MAG: lipocalin-like domain-containing protein [Bacteroidaceae bacterium]|nr:lipocalin-like domain-containing protein [Bacteroidaceae bacterium]